MAFEETTRDPLVDSNTYHQNQQFNSNINIFLFGSLLNSIEEKVLEGFKRVLVHMVDYPELDKQEIEHGSFSSDWTI